MEDICLFTRDEPKMTSEQTERFYKKLLEVKGVKNISEVTMRPNTTTHLATS